MAYQKSFKLAMMGEGDKTDLTRDEPRGTMLELRVRQMTLHQCMQHGQQAGGAGSGCAAGYDLVAITET